MIRYIVCDTDRLSEQDVADRLPAFAELADYSAALDMVGVRLTTETPVAASILTADALDGRFPRFPVMGHRTA